MATHTGKTGITGKTGKTGKTGFIWNLAGKPGKGTFSELEGWKNWKTIFKLKIYIAKLAKASFRFLGLRVLSLENFLVGPNHNGSSKNHFRLLFMLKITKNVLQPKFLHVFE